MTYNAMTSMLHGGAGGLAKKKDWRESLGVGMLLGGIGLDIFGELEEREQFAEDLEWEAAQRRLKAGQIGTLTNEQLIDIERAKYYATGEAKALQVAAGVKVGTGSALTQIKGIEGEFRRKSELIARKSGMERASMEMEATELEKRAKKMKEPDWWSIGSKLLSGGFMLGTGLGWF